MTIIPCKALLVGASLLALSCPRAAAETLDGDRIIIIDGDTVALPCDIPKAGCAEKIRLLDIDTPETFRPRCEDELAVGLIAKERLAELLRGHNVEVARSGRKDRYGRTLGSLRTDEGDAGEILLTEGLALRYEPGAAAWRWRFTKFCPGKPVPE